jgi:WD40 repeat protein
MMWIRFKHAASEAGVSVLFDNPPKYQIGYCSLPGSYTPFTIADGTVHIWTLKKYSTKLTLHCNEVEIFDYKFSDDTRTGCVAAWNHAFSSFQASSSDTASDFYRAAPDHGMVLL